MGDIVVGALTGGTGGAVGGMLVFLILVAATPAGPFLAGTAAAAGLGLIIAGGLTAGGAVAGGAIVASDTESEEKMKKGQVSLDDALSVLDLQGSLRDYVLQVAQSETPHRLVVLSGQTTTAVQTILQVKVDSIALRPRRWRQKTPTDSFFLSMWVTATLTGVSGGETLHTFYLEYHGQGHLFTEWAANNAALFREELRRAYFTLAVNVVDKFFVVLYPGLGPELLEPKKHRGVLIEPVTLVWTDFPSSKQRRTRRDLGNVRNVRYDVRVMLAEPEFATPSVDLDWSGGIVSGRPTFYSRKVVSGGPTFYSRQNLKEPLHELEQPLDRCTDYAWGVRARFDVNGQARTSDWITGVLPVNPSC